MVEGELLSQKEGKKDAAIGDALEIAFLDPPCWRPMIHVTSHESQSSLSCSRLHVQLSTRITTLGPPVCCICRKAIQTKHLTTSNLASTVQFFSNAPGVHCSTRRQA